ncbi:Dehydrogenase patE [Penicillium macrosclerotiorum]|uniref:Dehydrogenase patE n=1 Tax=Penicillium macrosclerotiorum TaxID=303699 RepID=UPI0025467735|nr:Dehydrogenase patE [Penicillium macrosclerotiorum]KAJ5698802.1 Dehydrogenase patE [Penicillium macrosclerotiorum]
MLLSTVSRLLAAPLFPALSTLAQWPIQFLFSNAFTWPHKSADANYDYVVVGAGTAGMTIAARLAQAGFQVALVEAGGYYESANPISQIPGAATVGIGANIDTATSVDWKFVAREVPGANHRDIHYPRGKCLGGSWVRRALTAVGIEEVQDFNGGSIMGHQFCTMSIRPADESRSSSESAFLQPPHNLDSLMIYQGTLATKILFDLGNRATGIKVQQQTQEFTLTAGREVIVSAGAFQSPQLLMVSGIGPADVLHKFAIKPIVTLPGVGQNMWDHVFFGPSYEVSVDTFTHMAQDPIFLASQVFAYMMYRDGMLTNPSTDYLAFEKLPGDYRSNFSAQDESQLSWFPRYWPEVEYLAGSAFVGNFSNPFAQQPSVGKYASIIASIVAPTSRGNVTIQSAHMADPPVINPNWLNTETDQKVAVAAYRRIRDTFSTQAMEPILIGPEYFPGVGYQTDEEILNVIKNTMMTIYHASCTCKMGTRGDRMAVVDNRARLFGVTGLRVVDASAFPLLPPGHPQSVVYMLAEKIAADILDA